MAEYARVVTFDADEAALDALLSEINSSDGPPAGVPAKRITVLADKAAGSMRRVSVDAYEVMLDREAP